jgi:serine/threonine protein kinase
MEDIDSQNQVSTRINLLIGQVIEDRYLIREKIGQGGVGAVYLAEDLKMMKRKVVIKILLENWLENLDVRRKFEQEKEALARLDHPGIINILDAGMIDSDKPYFVMPFVSGSTLRQYIKQAGFLPIPFCIDVIKCVTDALGAAHANGILHRDIKPENILVTEQPDGSIRVRLIDFGIARITNSQISPITEIERSVGTVLYIAPEQLLGSINQTPAGDIYSCGILFYELLTGRVPFNPHSIIEMWQLQKELAISLPSEIRHELTTVIDNIILMALSFNPEERYQVITDFGRALAHGLEKLSDKRLPQFETSIQTFVMSDAAIKVTETDTGEMPVQHTNENFGIKTGEVQIDQRKNSPSLISVEIDSSIPAGASKIQPANLTETNEKNSQQKNSRFLFTGIGVLCLALILAAAGFIFVFDKQKVEQPVAVTENKPIVNLTNSSHNLQFYLDIQKMRDGKPYGKPFRATGREIFETGYRFKINILSESSGNIYLFNEGKDEAGKYVFNMLFPTSKQQQGSPRLEAAQLIQSNENEFTGLPGKEIVWLIWTKEVLPELETARQNALSDGIVENAEIAQQLKLFLQKNAGEGFEVIKDNDDPKTTLRGNSNIMVYRMELEHR